MEEQSKPEPAFGVWSPSGGENLCFAKFWGKKLRQGCLCEFRAGKDVVQIFQSSIEPHKVISMLGLLKIGLRLIVRQGWIFL